MKGPLWFTAMAHTIRNCKIQWEKTAFRAQFPHQKPGNSNEFRGSSVQAGNSDPCDIQREFHGDFG